MHGETIKNI